MSLEELCASVAAAGVSDVRGVTDPSWGAGQVRRAVEGDMLVAGELLHIGVGLPSDFPDCLPRVFVLSPAAELLPHVDASRRVCAFEDENTLHDCRRGGAVIRETVERARSVIEEGLLGKNHADYLDELEAYWTAETAAASVVTPNDDARQVSVLYSGSTLVAVADSAAGLAVALPDLKGQFRTAVYLPLDASRMSAGHPGRLRSWPTVLANASDGAVSFLRRTAVAKKQKLFVVLGIPRPSGGHALVGLLLRKFVRDGALTEVSPQQVEPVALQRFDQVRVRERVPRRPRVAHAAVVGCGAVGGHVAHALAWSGARNLTLIDPDRADGANTFRHVLGRAGWFARSKVAGLKRDLEARIPDLKVIAHAKTVRQVLALEPEALRNVDVVVIAIGNPSVPLRLNDEFAAERFPVPVIYTWLEPHGIGGHALLVRYGLPGCLRCLFEDEPTLRCTVDFAAPGQRFTRRELGCHGLYTPYGDLDSRETALCAARIVERFAACPDTSAWLRSWRGNADAFLAAGFRLSARHEELASGYDGHHSPRPGCPACGA